MNSKLYNFKYSNFTAFQKIVLALFLVNEKKSIIFFYILIESFLQYQVKEYNFNKFDTIINEINIQEFGKTKKSCLFIIFYNNLFSHFNCLKF